MDPTRNPKNVIRVEFPSTSRSTSLSTSVCRSCKKTAIVQRVTCATCRGTYHRRCYVRHRANDDCDTKFNENLLPTYEEPGKYTVNIYPDITNDTNLLPSAPPAYRHVVPEPEIDNSFMAKYNIENETNTAIQEVLCDFQQKISRELSSVKSSISNLQSTVNAKQSHQMVPIDSRKERLESRNYCAIARSMDKISKKIEQVKLLESDFGRSEGPPETELNKPSTSGTLKVKISRETERMENSSSLKIYYQNVSDMRTKRRQMKFKEQVLLKENDCIAITKTGFDRRTDMNDYFDLNSMNVYRTDRRTKKKSDGVLLAIRKDIKASELALTDLNSDFSSIDTVGVEIILPNSVPLCVFVVYIPARASAHKLSKYLRSFALLDCIKDKKCLIVGDFNCEYFVIDEPLEEGLEAAAVKAFMNQLRLKQFNHVRNKNNRLLELVLCGPRCPLKLSHCPNASLLTKEDGQHPALIIEADVE